MFFEIFVCLDTLQEYLPENIFLFDAVKTVHSESGNNPPKSRIYHCSCTKLCIPVPMPGSLFEFQFRLNGVFFYRYNREGFFVDGGVRNEKWWMKSGEMERMGSV